MTPPANPILDKIQQQAINPLHHLFMVAGYNHEILEQRQDADNRQINQGERWLNPYTEENIGLRMQNEPATQFFTDKLSASVYGLKQWLLDEQDWDILYLNESLPLLQGVDAVAWKETKDVFVLCEAHGSEAEYKSPASYLKHNQTKGRQLSWQWCWDSVMTLAFHPQSAGVFLRLFRPLIRLHNVERLLAVTRVEAHRKGFSPLEVRVWEEWELNRLSELRQTKDWSQYAKWLEELDDHLSEA